MKAFYRNRNPAREETVDLSILEYLGMLTVKLCNL